MSKKNKKNLQSFYSKKTVGKLLIVKTITTNTYFDNERKHRM